MNPRDAFDVMTNEGGMGTSTARYALNALAAAGLVVVPCARGERVVADRTTPCATCAGRGSWCVGAWVAGIRKICTACHGSGWGDDVVLHGLTHWGDIDPDDDEALFMVPIFRLVPVTPSPLNVVEMPDGSLHQRDRGVPVTPESETTP